MSATGSGGNTGLGGYFHSGCWWLGRLLFWALLGRSLNSTDGPRLPQKVSSARRQRVEPMEGISSRRISPAALIIGAQRSISLTSVRWAASGVALSSDIGSVLISLKRFTKSGSLSAPLRATESFWTIAGAVPFGANTPCQTASSKSFSPAYGLI